MKRPGLFRLCWLILMLVLAACGGGGNNTGPSPMGDVPQSANTNVTLVGGEPVFMNSYAAGINTVTGPDGAVMHIWSAEADGVVRSSAVNLVRGAWVPLDDLEHTAAVSYAFDATGAPVALVRSVNDRGFTTSLDAVRWDGVSWVPLGPPLTANLDTVDVLETIPSLDLAGGVLVAVFHADSFSRNQTGLFAVVYDGTSWQPVGNGPLYDAVDFDDFQLVIDDAGNPVVVVVPDTDFPNTLLAYRWDGTVWQVQPTYSSPSADGGYSFIIDAVAETDDLVVLFVSGDGANPKLLRLRSGRWSDVGGGARAFDLATDADGDALVLAFDETPETNLFSMEDANLVTLRGDRVLALNLDTSPLRVVNGPDNAVYVLTIPGSTISTSQRSALIYRYELPE